MWRRAKSAAKTAVVRVLPVPGGPCTKVNGMESACWTDSSCEGFNAQHDKSCSSGRSGIAGGTGCAVSTSARASGARARSAKAQAMQLSDSIFGMVCTMWEPERGHRVRPASGMSWMVTCIMPGVTSDQNSSSSPKTRSRSSSGTQARTTRAWPVHPIAPLPQPVWRRQSQEEPRSPPAMADRNFTLCTLISRAGTSKVPRGIPLPTESSASVSNSFGSCHSIQTFERT
mmetsp:Transcript_65424/g.128959  ORF Transcript_65424/g.128959 Transcript_65424/m.128959 type:complete len:229 (-) Transcript_65424:390-1076(-)